MSQSTTLENLVHWKDFCQESPLFKKNEEALRWFIRKHQDGLVDAGVIVKISNSWHLVRPEFDSVAIDLLRTEAKLQSRTKRAA